MARALSEEISRGESLMKLTGASRGAKGISGTHRKSGPELTLLTYDGRVLVHKKGAALRIRLGAAKPRPIR